MRRSIKSKYCSVITQNSDAIFFSVFVSGKHAIPSAREALIRVFNTARPQRERLALIKRRNVTTNTLEAICQDEIWHALIVARTVTHWFNTSKSALVQVGNPSDRNKHYTQAENDSRHHISGCCNYTSKRKRCSKRSLGIDMTAVLDESLNRSTFNDHQQTQLLDLCRKYWFVFLVSSK